MGQPLPLPEKIPRPTDAQNESLKQMGIIVDLDGQDPDVTPPYVTYKLPNEWKIVNRSWRNDLPIYYIVDDQNKRRVSICGAWKGTYDNELNMYILSDLKNDDESDRS